MNKYFLPISFLFLICTNCISQSKRTELFITPGVNIYIPGSSSAKSTYPIIGYKKNTDPRLLIGGFSIGVTVFKPLQTNMQLKLQGALSRNAHWNEFINATDIAGNSLIGFKNSTINYNVDFLATVRYRLFNKFYAGAGSGLQLLVASVSRNPFKDILINGATQPNRIIQNKYYRTLMPFIPLEISYQTKKVNYNIRYDFALLNKVKGELANYLSERYGLLHFEVGFKIR